MKITNCKFEYSIDDHLSIRLEAESYEDIALLHSMGLNIKQPVKSSGGFLQDGVYLWIHIPVKKNRKWGFNNDTHK